MIQPSRPSSLEISLAPFDRLTELYLYCATSHYLKIEYLYVGAHRIYRPGFTLLDSIMGIVSKIIKYIASLVCAF